MNAEVVVVRMILAGIFVAAALAKLVDLRGAQEAVQNFGFPFFLALPIALTLPPLELVIVWFLVVPSNGFCGGAASLALFGAFTVVIALNLARGRKPACHCFGQLHTAPIGWKTVLRNGTFCAGAAFVTWAGQAGIRGSVIGSIASWARHPDTNVWFAGLGLGAIVIQSWVIFHLFMQQGRLLIRVEKIAEGINDVDSNPTLPLGSPAPAFELPGLGGGVLSITSMLAPGKALLLVFSEPRCKSCNEMLPEIALWKAAYKDSLSFGIVSSGDPDANRVKFESHGINEVALQTGRELAERYFVKGTPSAILVSNDGLIASKLAMGPLAIRTLVQSAVGEDGAAPHENSIAPSQVVVGVPIPQFRLPILAGGELESNELIGRETYLLFWNPRCQYCADLLPRIQKYEASLGPDSARVVVVSTAEEESNRAMQLKSTVVLDRGFSIGKQIGISGTPSGVFIDAEGKVASLIQVGASGVLSLLGIAGRLHKNGDFAVAL